MNSFINGYNALIFVLVPIVILAFALYISRRMKAFREISMRMEENKLTEEYCEKFKEMMRWNKIAWTAGSLGFDDGKKLHDEISREFPLILSSINSHEHKTFMVKYEEMSSDMVVRVKELEEKISGFIDAVDEFEEMPTYIRLSKECEQLCGQLDSTISDKTNNDAIKQRYVALVKLFLAHSNKMNTMISLKDIKGAISMLVILRNTIGLIEDIKKTIEDVVKRESDMVEKAQDAYSLILMRIRTITKELKKKHMSEENFNKASNTIEMVRGHLPDFKKLGFQSDVDYIPAVKHNMELFSRLSIALNEVDSFIKSVDVITQVKKEIKDEL